MDQDFTAAGDAVTWFDTDEPEQYRDWVMIATFRPCDPGDRATHLTMLREIERVCGEDACVSIRSTACCSLYFLAPPGRDDVLELAAKMVAIWEEQGIIDEGVYQEVCDEMTNDYWTEASFGERVQLLVDHSEPVTCAFQDKPPDNVRPAIEEMAQCGC